MSDRSVAFSAITSWPNDAAAGGRDARPLAGGGAAESDTAREGVSRPDPDPCAGALPGGPAAVPWQRWAASVRAMAAGCYSTAWPVLLELAAGADPELSGLADATMASGLRQVGRHAEAAPLDEAAIDSAGAGVLDGLTGRAADAIGLGRPEQTEEYLRRAEAFLPEVPDQELRGTVRIGWVRAEMQLLLGEPAVGSAAQALAAARRLGSPRHVLKSRLIHAVARLVAGDPDCSADLLAVIRDADRLGIRTLLWPAALALGDELPAAERVAAVAAVGFIRGHLPPGDSSDWLATVADLADRPGAGDPA